MFFDFLTVNIIDNQYRYLIQISQLGRRRIVEICFELMLQLPLRQFGTTMRTIKNVENLILIQVNRGAGRVNAFETTEFGIYCSDSTLVTSATKRSSLMGCGGQITRCCGSSGVTIVVPGASWTAVRVAD